MVDCTGAAKSCTKHALGVGAAYQPSFRLRDMPRPPMVAIVGKKHSGKTTMVVRLAAALRERGHRVMTIKHGSHTFNIDPSTTDTYRHYHEGEAERVAMVAPDKFALIIRQADTVAPEAIAEQYMADADVVLCEG